MNHKTDKEDELSEPFDWLGIPAWIEVLLKSNCEVFENKENNS